MKIIVQWQFVDNMSCLFELIAPIQKALISHSHLHLLLHFLAGKLICCRGKVAGEVGNVAWF